MVQRFLQWTDVRLTALADGDYKGALYNGALGALGVGGARNAAGSLWDDAAAAALKRPLFARPKRVDPPAAPKPARVTGCFVAGTPVIIVDGAWDEALAAMPPEAAPASDDAAALHPGWIIASAAFTLASAEFARLAVPSRRRRRIAWEAIWDEAIRTTFGDDVAPWQEQDDGNEDNGALALSGGVRGPYGHD